MIKKYITKGDCEIMIYQGPLNCIQENCNGKLFMKGGFTPQYNPETIKKIILGENFSLRITLKCEKCKSEEIVNIRRGELVRILTEYINGNVRK